MTQGMRKGLTSYGDSGFSLFLRKAFIKAMGYSDEALARPIVGIADTSSDYNACHGNVAALVEAVKRGVLAGLDLNSVYRETYAALKPKFGHWVIFAHCLPCDVTRAYDEATQYPDPRIWTAQRDKEMWETLEG